MSIKLKTEHDIKYIKKAIKIGEKILSRMTRYIKPGVTSKQLNKKIDLLIFWSIPGAISSFKGYKGFPTVSCIGINEDIIHGIPNDIPLKNGDLVKIDLGINYKGYYSDQARTYIVGKPLTSVHTALIYATKRALDRAVFLCFEGNTIGDISYMIEETAKDFGLGILKDFGGHGTGLAIHSEPFIPNRVGKNKEVKLVKGMVIAIEPMFVLNGKGNYTIAKDGWTVKADGLGAHFERTVIIQ